MVDTAPLTARASREAGAAVDATVAFEDDSGLDYDCW